MLIDQIGQIIHIRLGLFCPGGQILIYRNTSVLKTTCSYRTLTSWGGDARGGSLVLRMSKMNRVFCCCEVASLVFKYLYSKKCVSIVTW